MTLRIDITHFVCLYISIKMLKGTRILLCILSIQSSEIYVSKVMIN